MGANLGGSAADEVEVIGTDGDGAERWEGVDWRDDERFCWPMLLLFSWSRMCWAKMSRERQEKEQSAH